jgi:hypothetical protein
MDLWIDVRGSTDASQRVPSLWRRGVAVVRSIFLLIKRRFLWASPRISSCIPLDVGSRMLGGLKFSLVRPGGKAKMMIWNSNE